MTSLQTYHVEDWAEFIEKNDIDLHCPACKGEGTIPGKTEDEEHKDCEECSGSGYMEILWDTIWNTGFHANCDGPKLPAEAHGVAIFEYDGMIWFGLQGCGMDLTPHLAAAWADTFPDCEWLPEQFIVTGCNLRGGYIESCLGKPMARRIYALIGKTIKGAKRQAAYLAEDLKVARKRLAAK